MRFSRHTLEGPHMRKLILKVLVLLRHPASPTAISFLSLFVVVAFFYFGKGLDTKLAEWKDLVTDVKSVLAVQKDMYHLLLPTINGGRVVSVGMNRRDLTDNHVSVFRENDLGLKVGDVIQLRNFHDGSFKPMCEFLVTKGVPRGGDTTKADIFISEEGLSCLKLADIRSLGVVQLKMLGPSNGRVAAP